MEAHQGKGGGAQSEVHQVEGLEEEHSYPEGALGEGRGEGLHLLEALHSLVEEQLLLVLLVLLVVVVHLVGLQEVEEEELHHHHHLQAAAVVAVVVVAAARLPHPPLLSCHRHPPQSRNHQHHLQL